jgi:solute carrier family 25 folate transporter 32
MSEAGSTSKKSNNTALHLASGSIAGFVTTALLHPLDSIKVRFQAHEGTTGLRTGSSPGFRSTYGAFAHVIKTEGFRPLYFGLAPALIANGASWGLYFYFYEHCKQIVYERYKDAGSYGVLASGVAAGMCTVLLTNPIWLLKTRMQLERSSQRMYVGLLPSIFRILREEGMRGLYRGIIPALFLTTHGGVQFAIYEKLKDMNTARRHGAKGEPQEFLVMGGVSKVVATIATYPAQVVKTRMQQRKYDASSLYSRTFTTIGTIVHNERLPGLYKGLGPTLWRVAPQSAVMLTVYEEVYKILCAGVTKTMESR